MFICPFSSPQAVGALATFFGYFLLGPVLFTTAFFIGGGACFVAVRAGLSNSEASAWLSIIAMLVGGGFSGFAACRMLALGMFAVGACLGVAISAALKVILWTRVFPASPHAGFIFGSTILGIIFGFTALSLRKQMLILVRRLALKFGEDHLGSTFRGYWHISLTSVFLFTCYGKIWQPISLMCVCEFLGFIRYQRSQHLMRGLLACSLESGILPAIFLLWSSSTKLSRACSTPGLWDILHWQHSLEQLACSFNYIWLETSRCLLRRPTRDGKGFAVFDKLQIVLIGPLMGMKNGRGLYWRPSLGLRGNLHCLARISN